MQIVKTFETNTANSVAGQLPHTLICFSHLRWDFVFQRPQHILNRLAKQMRVYYIEEPVADSSPTPHYVSMQRGDKLTILVPHLPSELCAADSQKAQQDLFAAFMLGRSLEDIAFWYYTPMALPFTRAHHPVVTIFDCMDELSAFKFAPQELKDLEQELLLKADIVFTGGQSLYEAKKNDHGNIHAFPSSIDKQHFAKARKLQNKKKDRPFTLGFYGVIDERFDIELIRGIAEQRPEWSIMLIGPVVKIDSATLPSNGNISYLGSKTYEELPELISNWDVALIPFLLNESTRFISPTKTPEYLAGGLPVISTPIHDVVHPYGAHKLVMIGTDTTAFITLAEQVQQNEDKKEWLQRVDFFLSDNSWDNTCSSMLQLIGNSISSEHQSKSLIKTAISHV